MKPPKSECSGCGVRMYGLSLVRIHDQTGYDFLQSYCYTCLDAVTQARARPFTKVGRWSD